MVKLEDIKKNAKIFEMDRLSDALIRAPLYRSRLIVVNAEQIEQIDSLSLNLNLLLSEQLISTPKQERAKSVALFLDQIIRTVSEDIVCLSGLEILFDRSLAIDPIRLLASCSKNKTLLVSWPGDKTSSGLSYATPSHPEHRNYKASDLSDVIFLTADAQLHLRNVNEIR